MFKIVWPIYLLSNIIAIWSFLILWIIKYKSTPCPEQTVFSVVPGQVLKLNCCTGRHLWLKQMRSVPQAVPSSTYPRSVSPSISTWAPLNDKKKKDMRPLAVNSVQQIWDCVCLIFVIYICIFQDNDWYCWKKQGWTVVKYISSSSVLEYLFLETLLLLHYILKEILYFWLHCLSTKVLVTG